MSGQARVATDGSSSSNGINYKGVGFERSSAQTQLFESLIKLSEMILASMIISCLLFLLLKVCVFLCMQYKLLPPIHITLRKYGKLEPDLLVHAHTNGACVDGVAYK
jgi:hypothetical protein